MGTTERGSDDVARGLGPTRARVLALLQDAAEPMTAAAAGARLGLHVNSVRFHLDALTEDGLVTRRREERSTPGRPKVLYAAATTAPPVAHRSYRLLAEILTSFLADRLPDPGGSAEQAGEAWGRYLTPAPEPFRRPREPEALDSLVQALDRMGFDSHVVDEPGSLRLEISHCPFLEVAAEHNEVVCSIHLGLMRGVLEQIGAPASVDTLEPLVEPSRCVAHLSRG
ncbi:MAG: helix-turn-helix transcriptional regulator [Actinomycetota bacterium]